MKTTVTLDPDVERLLKEAQQRGSKTFEETLNEAIRLGLKESATGKEAEFQIVARPLRLREGLDPSRLQDLDDDLEIAEFLRKTKALNDRPS